VFSGFIKILFPDVGESSPRINMTFKGGRSDRYRPHLYGCLVAVLGWAAAPQPYVPFVLLVWRSVVLSVPALLYKTPTPHVIVWSFRGALGARCISRRALSGVSSRPRGFLRSRG